MEKSIGIVIATFNGEKYIKTQLLSILNQTQKPTKIIITDASSSDKTIYIADSILCKHEIDYKIFTSQKRLSVIENFQKGIDNCDCDYIFLSDQDDFWLENKIETTIQHIIKNDAIMAFCNASLVDKDLKSKNQNLWNHIKFQQNNQYKVYKRNDSNFVMELIKRNVVTGMCLCIKKELKKFILPLSKNTLHDSWIALNAITNGNVIAINKELVLYRQHDSNVIGGNNTSLRQKKSKLNKYLDNIYKRYFTIEEWMTKNSYSTKHVTDYLLYLSNRIDYLTKKTPIFFLFSFLLAYRKYTINSASIIIKDLYFRYMYKNDNK